MGAKPSIPNPDPERFPVDATAAKLVLTRVGAGNALYFSERLDQPRPVACRLKSGLGLVARQGTPSGPHAREWMWMELGVGPAKLAIRASIDSAGFFCWDVDDRVLDIAHWKYEDGNDVGLLTHVSNRKKIRLGGGGRTFRQNDDGSVSPAHAPHLCLGYSLPDLTLVPANSPGRLVFDAYEFATLRQGGEARLVLDSHRGYAVVAKSTPRRIHEWALDYQHLGIGPVGEAAALKVEPVGEAAALQVEHFEFLVSATPSSRGFVLDVPFDKRVEGTGDLPLAFIHFDHGRNKEKGNNARRFIMNKDQTISPAASPHLVFGVLHRLLPIPTTDEIPIAVDEIPIAVATVVQPAFVTYK